MISAYNKCRNILHPHKFKHEILGKIFKLLLTMYCDGYHVKSRQSFQSYWNHIEFYTICTLNNPKQRSSLVTSPVILRVTQTFHLFRKWVFSKFLTARLLWAGASSCWYIRFIFFSKGISSIAGYFSHHNSWVITPVNDPG